MKNLLRHILSISLMILSSQVIFAQTTLEKQTIQDLSKTPNYVFGVSDEEGLKSALSVYDFMIENGVQIENFEVVVKGQVVKSMVKGSELESYFEKYKGLVKVSICSVAMNRRGVSSDQLFEGLDVVETYTIRILQLQALGYNSMIY